jgi:hypothetical protein
VRPEKSQQLHHGRWKNTIITRVRCKKAISAEQRKTIFCIRGESYLALCVGSGNIIRGAMFESLKNFTLFLRVRIVCRFQKM